MRLDLLGYGLEVEDASPKVRAWLEDYWGFSYPGRGSTDPVTLHFVTEPPEAPKDVPRTLARFAEGSIPCLNQDPIFWLGDAGCGVRLDTEKGTLQAWGESGALFGQLHIALTECVRVQGLLPLHAAVVTKDGYATAFLGSSGSGKTTALLSAIERGYRALAEDFVWLEPDTLRVYRWDRGLRLLPDTFARFAATVAGCASINHAGKRFVRYSDLGWSAPEGALSRLYKLCPDGTFNEPQVLTRLEATRLLWEATGVPLSNAARKHTGRLIPQILERVSPQLLSRNVSLAV